MKKYLLFFLGCLLTLCSEASRFRYGNTIVISSPVYENLYVAGRNVVINAPVYGDLVVAGGSVTINDTVTRDILVAGGTVEFNGYAGDDIRCAGGKLYIRKNVSGDVVCTGGTITIDKGVTVGGLLSGGGEIVVNGTIAGDARIASAILVLNGTATKSLACQSDNITINGKVEGPAELAASSEMSIGADARFNSGVRYWTPGEQVDFKQSVARGKALYDPSLKMPYSRWYYMRFSSLLALLWYTGMAFLLVMLVQYFFGGTMQRAGEVATVAVWKSFGIGLLFWLGVPVAIAVAFVSLIGVPVGLILLVMYLLLLMLALVVASVVVANWMNSRSGSGWGYWRMVLASLGVFVLLKILSFTPVLGWLLLVILVCICYGAVLQSIRVHRKYITPTSIPGAG